MDKITFLPIKDYTPAKAYGCMNNVFFDMFSAFNREVLKMSPLAGARYIDNVSNTNLCYAGGVVAGNSGCTNVSSNGSSPPPWSDGSSYNSFSLLSTKLIMHVKVQKVSTMPLTQAYVYPLHTKVNDGYSMNRAYTGSTAPPTMLEWKALHNNDYVVTGIDFYDNARDGAISKIAPRTKKPTPTEVYLRIPFGYISAAAVNVCEGTGDGDMLVPVTYDLLGVNDGVSGYPATALSTYYAERTTDCFSVALYNVNTNLNAVANGQGLKCFSSLSTITTLLNGVGMPFTYSLTEATDNNTNKFTDYIPAGQPTDTTGGGTGNGNNLNDPMTQVSPSISTVGAFNNHYAMSQSMLSVLGTYLWTSTFLNDIKLLYNSPAEGIISCKMFPFSLESHDPANVGASTPIVVGNVTTTASGYPLSGAYNAYFPMGSIKIEEYYGGALDYEPYTDVEIFLPYLGIRKIGTNDVMGQTISITYIIDITTGSMIVEIWRGTQLLYTFDGKIGIDIPISSSNSAQFTTSAALTGITGVAGLATGIASGNPLVAVGSVISTAKSVASNQFRINKGGVNSPSAGLYMPQAPYLIITRPVQSLASSFGATHGFPCNVSKSLGSVTGYTEIDTPVLTGIPATEEEKAQIKNLLETGVIFT